MNQRGIADFGLRESTNDNSSFSTALDAAKSANKHGAFVDPQPAERLDAEGTKTYLSDNQSAGVAVKRDGDIVGVFKNPTDPRSGAVGDLIITALSNGGSKLDCYGMDLGDKYTQFGFVPAARMDFNAEYATEWKPEFGTPDVIFWMHNGDSVETVAQKHGNYSDFSNAYIKSLPTFTDYDAAYRYRDMLLEQSGHDTGKPSGGQGANPDGSVGAAQSGFDPYSQMQNEQGTIPPGEQPRAREVDVPQSTDGTDRVSRYARTLMEAPATPDEMIADFEQGVAEGDFSYTPRKQKDILNKQVSFIEQSGYEEALRQWDGAVKRGSVDDNTMILGQVLYAEAAKAGDTQTAMKLAAELAAEGTRAGQTVSAQRMLKRLTPDGRLYYAERSVDNLTKGLKEKYGDKAPDLKMDETLVQDLLNAKSTQDMDTAQKALFTDIANQMPSTWQDKWDAWRYTAMLGNPRTHIRNIVGNFLFGNKVLSPRSVKNKIGAVLETAADKAARMRGGDGIERSKSTTTKAEDRAFAKQDFGEMQSVLQGTGKYNTADSIKSLKTNPFGNGPLAQMLNKASNLNSAALEAEDVFALKGAYVDSLAQYMKSNGLTSADMTGATLEKARTYAVAEAQKATFRDANALASALNKFSKGGGKLRQIAVEGLIPFKKTPANIVSRGIEYSPYGVLKGMKEIALDVRNGDKTPAQAIDTLSAGLTGTGITTLGMFLAAQGIISGGDDDDSKKQYFDEMGGAQSYALDLSAFGIDKTYTIDWSAPASLPLFVGVEMWDAMQADEEQLTAKYALEAFSNITEPVFNLTMMDGINRAIKSATYDGGAPISSAIISAGTNYFTQGVPTALGQINRSFFDDTRRSTFIEQDSPLPKGVDRAIQQQMAKIPGLSQKLNPYTDNFGRAQKNGSWMENFFSPGYISDKTSTEAEQALSTLYDATGDSTILPSKPQKYYTLDSEKKWLTAEQYLQLSNTKGQTSLEQIGTLVKSAAYQDMNDTEKAAAVKDIYNYAAAVAANKTYGRELEGTVKTVAESGIEPGLYYGYKEMQDTIAENEESFEARDAVFHAIRGDSTLSDDQCNKLYDTLLIKGTSENQYKKYQEIGDVVTKEEYIDAMIQSQAIKAGGEEIENGRATVEATEFSKYLDVMGYEGEKRAALADTFKFYSMFPAEPQNYTFDMLREGGSANEREHVNEIENAGITAPEYLNIKSGCSSFKADKDENGKSVSGSKKTKVAQYVSEHVESYDQFASVMGAMGYKIDGSLYTAGGKRQPAEETTIAPRAVNVGNNWTVNPVKASNATIVSDFGPRNAPNTTYGRGSSNHRGIDIGGVGGNLDGQETDTVGDGTVQTVAYDPQGYGNYVIIDHGNGYKTLYGHLQKATVQQGQTVKAGQQIGVIGGTGNVEAPHLHLSAWQNGKEIDPAMVIPGF